MGATAGDHHHQGRASSRRSLWIAMGLISSYMLIEVVGGLLANSLALLADAGHMLTDVGAIGLALLAMWMSARPASFTRTFGFQRTEVLAALLNALALWVIATWVFVEAYQRFRSPVEAQGTVMLVVGLIGLLVNSGAAWVLRRPARDNLNVEGAFLHVLGDLVGSIAVVAGGILVVTLDWQSADPVFGVLIGLLILASSGRLLWKVLHVLMQGTPSRLDLSMLCESLEELEGVTGVHDIHAWSVTTDYEVLSAHVITDVTAAADREYLLHHLREIVSHRFGIAHVTIQLEESGEECDEAHHVAHAAE